MREFKPRLEILPPAQRALWDELGAIPSTFILYGGTGLALRLGHRESIDFDFFSSDPLNRHELQRQISFLKTAEVLLESQDSLTISVGREAPVKVSFFGPIGFGRVGEPELTEDGVIRVASLLDLGATKVKALLQRVESKDYRDMAALLKSGQSLPRILSAARALFGQTFNPLMAQKTLAFFEGGDLSRLDAPTRELLSREALKDAELPEVPLLSPRLE